jgi:hypothetical protein
MKVEVKFAWVDQRENYARALIRLYLVDDVAIAAAQAEAQAKGEGSLCMVPAGARTLIVEKVVERFQRLDRSQIDSLANALAAIEALKRTLDVIKAI